MYNALINNDEKYDGSFFYGVKTTGVYCIPSCKSKKPRQENVEYFRTKAEAELAGYRPCKRCKSDVLDYKIITKEIPRKVKDIIDTNYTDGEELNNLITELGFSSKRIVEIFKKEYGMTIAAYTNSVRLSKARELLEKTEDMVLDIAFAVGFSSLSAFYSSFSKNVGVSPLKFRKNMKKKNEA